MTTHVQWPDDDSGLPTWDQRILALLPPGVDETQLKENLRLTPTQRIEQLQAMAEAFEQMRPAQNK